MGDIAEMMLDGTLCEGCGEYIGGGDGFPRYCSPSCARDRGYHHSIERDLDAALKPWRCPVCKKNFGSEDARRQHMRDAGHDLDNLLRCSCGNLCKGAKGLEMHRAAKGCL